MILKNKNLYLRIFIAFIFIIGNTLFVPKIYASILSNQLKTQNKIILWQLETRLAKEAKSLPHRGLVAMDITKDMQNHLAIHYVYIVPTDLDIQQTMRRRLVICQTTFRRYLRLGVSLRYDFFDQNMGFDQDGFETKSKKRFLGSFTINEQVCLQSGYS